MIQNLKKSSKASKNDGDDDLIVDDFFWLSREIKKALKEKNSDLIKTTGQEKEKVSSLVK